MLTAARRRSAQVDLSGDTLIAPFWLQGWDRDFEELEEWIKRLIAAIFNVPVPDTIPSRYDWNWIIFRALEKSGEGYVWGTYYIARWQDAHAPNDAPPRAGDVYLAFQAILEAGEVKAAYRFIRG